MAGPLGGLWPGLTRNSTTLKYLFSGALVAMYAGYLLALYYARQLRARWVFAAIAAVHALFLLSVTGIVIYLVLDFVSRLLLRRWHESAIESEED